MSDQSWSQHVSVLTIKVLVLEATESWLWSWCTFTPDLKRSIWLSS